MQIKERRSPNLMLTWDFHSQAAFSFSLDSELELRAGTGRSPVSKVLSRSVMLSQALPQRSRI